ncbi:50S ribosomal protein L3 [Elysia marginata]|uniref:Large ribosomal subunit protein uL3m n=1 Tax=Elysia marginata TaxID=1093978 RepID=A0AAV4IG27_9GAST|nr:50S ribosomal protein L3 [Elysia marginata]
MASRTVLTLGARPLGLSHNLCGNLTTLTGLEWSSVCVQQVRYRRFPKFVVRPTTRRPWHVRKWTEKKDEFLDKSNEQFVREVIADKYAKTSSSPLKDGPWERNPYLRGTRRSGVLALKLGTLIHWKKDGTPFTVTVLQVLDNHVINYVPPEVYATYPSHCPHQGLRFGLQVVGSLSCDPRQFSKPYNNLFVKAGVPPKRWLTRFLVTPDAAIQPGTALNVNHFKVGDYVDTQGRTRDYGFQGVIKRWGMKGMPKSHGTTKSERKMGATGGGGDKDGIWKGKRMPGMMGNYLRTMYGLQICRINTRYNLLYVAGVGVPGLPHTFIRVSDTVLPRKQRTEDQMSSVAMPTWFEEDEEDPLPEEMFVDDVFQFTEPSLELEAEES